MIEWPYVTQKHRNRDMAPKSILYIITGKMASNCYCKGTETTMGVIFSI